MTAPTRPFRHNLHVWCQSGDKPNRIWMLIFDDQDVRQMVWTDDDAETLARAAWDRYAPAWNCTLLCTAEQEPPPS